MKNFSITFKCTLLAFFIFSNLNSAFSQWEFVKNGIAPKGAFAAAKSADGKPIFIARADYKGEIHIGTFTSGAKEAVFAANNFIFQVKDFEIFTGTGKWAAVQKGDLPDNAFEGGSAPDGSKIFVARAKIGKDGWGIGGFFPPVAYFPVGQIVQTLTTGFEILVIEAAPSCVTVYPLPNYGGTGQNFCTAGVQNLQFPARSMRVEQGYEVYMRNVGECFSGKIYKTDTPEMEECNESKTLAILALPSTKKTELTLRQIGYNIHDNDCRKMYGIAGTAVVFEDLGFTAFAIGETDGGYNLINWPDKGPVRAGVFDFGQINNANNPINVVKTFRIDQSLWRKSKIQIFTNLGSAHKGCGTCTDFTWNVKMPAPQTEDFNLDVAQTLYASPAYPNQIMPTHLIQFDSQHKAVLYFKLRRL